MVVKGDSPQSLPLLAKEAHIGQQFTSLLWFEKFSFPTKESRPEWTSAFQIAFHRNPSYHNDSTPIAHKMLLQKISNF